MEDYTQLAEFCQMHTEICATLLDKFLLPLAARQGKLFREMDQRFKPYRHILQLLPRGTEDMLRTQYIGQRLFRNNGLIHKLMAGNALDELNPEMQAFLAEQAATPWRFCFSAIVERPAKDFFHMQDIFSGASFLLYSPGAGKILETQAPILWLNLIGFNGSCWQSFGPISAYNGYEPDDIFFFATELHTYIENEEDLAEDMHENPVPYMMLISGANTPLIFAGKDQTLYMQAEYDCEPFDVGNLRTDFEIDNRDQVWRMGLRRLNEHPHFATAYYDERKKSLSLFAMTRYGYGKLISRLRSYGFEVEDEADMCVNPSMFHAMSSILKKRIVLDPYGSLFQAARDPAQTEEIAALNELAAMIMEELNAGSKPDVATLAEKSGQDPENVANLINTLTEVFNRMDSGMR